MQSWTQAWDPADPLYRGTPCTVAVVGGPRSGKTALARHLVHLLCEGLEGIVLTRRPGEWRDVPGAMCTADPEAARRLVMATRRRVASMRPEAGWTEIPPTLAYVVADLDSVDLEWWADGVFMCRDLPGLVSNRVGGVTVIVASRSADFLASPAPRPMLPSTLRFFRAVFVMPRSDAALRGTVHAGTVDRRRCPLPQCTSDCPHDPRTDAFPDAREFDALLDHVGDGGAVVLEMYNRGRTRYCPPPNVYRF